MSEMGRLGRKDDMSATLPTEGFQHCFRERDDDPLRCLHCDGYPFDLRHWCTG